MQVFNLIKRLFLLYATWAFYIQFHIFANSITNQHYPISLCQPLNNLSYTSKILYTESYKNSFIVGWSLLSADPPKEFSIPSVGDEIQIARCVAPGRWLFLAVGNIKGISGKMVEAHVRSFFNSEDANNISQKQYSLNRWNMLLRPMGGDIIIPIKRTITKSIRITPRIELDIQSLFAHTDNGYSFELSEQGMQLLNDSFKKFAHLNGRLLIESVQNTIGDRETLRTESMMRAQTVSNYLIRAFDLDTRSIVPIGLGNENLQVGLKPVKYNINGELITASIVLKIFPE